MSQAMTDAEKRKRCEFIAYMTHASKQVDAMLAFAAEREAAMKVRLLKPTDEMIEAGMEKSVLGRPSIDDESYVLSIWSAMIERIGAGEG